MIILTNYKSGDIVRVFYPYTPKVLNKDGENIEGKRRFGLIVNAGNNKTIAIPILQIFTRDGKTNEPNYRLRKDELYIPEKVTYYKRSENKDIDIKGVIKTERIEFFDDDEISVPLTTVGLPTKTRVLETYKSLMEIPHFYNKLNRESPGHKEAMETFERAIIAEKLGFLTTDLGEFKYENLEDTMLKINKIQPLGKSNINKRIHFYAVEITDEENKDSFFYTISTMKRPHQVAREWGKPRAAVDWLKEDERFYNLQKDIHKTFEADPNPHPNKYKAFAVFRRNALEHSMER